MIATNLLKYTVVGTLHKEVRPRFYSLKCFRNKVSFLVLALADDRLEVICGHFHFYPGNHDS